MRKLYNVRIVDDEKWMRKGIINAIQWEKLGLRLVAEASRAKEALEQALREKPHIILMDMRMPGMSGIELMKQIKDDLPSTKVMIISGYSDFEYTREAIIHNVYRYILKPIEKEELNKVMTDVIKELGTHTAQDHMIKPMLFGFENGFTDQNFQAPSPYFKVCTMYLDQSRLSSGRAQSRGIVEEKIDQYCRAYQTNMMHDKNKNNEIVVII